MTKTAGRWKNALEISLRQSASERCGSVKAPEIIDSEPEAAWRDSPLGKTVAVTVDRALGTKHPEHQELEYLLNYGYVQDVLAADNEWRTRISMA